MGMLCMMKTQYVTRKQRRKSLGKSDSNMLLSSIDSQRSPAAVCLCLPKELL